MTVRRDTGPVRLPALPPVNAQDPSLRDWMSAVAERLETREGTRGNRFERVVTLRELEDATKSLTGLAVSKIPAAGEVLIDLGGGLTASVAIDNFVAELKSTRLYTDLLRRLDDPNRFNDLAVEVRSILLKSIADEAAARGADIRRTETLIQDSNRSLAIAVEEITAAVGTSAAGVRELTSAVATSTSATAVKVTQLESSLGNYYQDGTAGRAVLESTLTTQASFTTGLRAQYTLKVQAGGALAGFGIAATEINGTPSSAFIISADKFAIVAPNYSGGLTTAPSNNDVPFGVDADGIYMNTNVYVRGTMKVDTGGKTLANGLRGSLNLSVTASAWSDTTARQAVWTALGNAGSAVNNNHLVIGDTVTISNSASPPTYVQTKYWNNSAWTDSGVIINGNLLVDGSIAAGKIDTRGLTIKDSSGNIILSSGVPLEWQNFTTSLASAPAGIVNSNVTATSINAVATNLSNAPSGILNNSITIGSNGTLSGAGGGTVTISGLDSTVVRSANPITLANVGTYIGTGAITNAYIGNFIQSTVYQPFATYGAAASGWQIDKNGSAEFNDLTLRSGQIDGLLLTAYKINQYSGLYVRISASTPISSTNGPYYLNGDTSNPHYLVYNANMPAPATAPHKIFMSVNVQALGVSATRDLAVLVLINASISGTTITASEQLAYNTNSGTFGICTNATGVTTNTYATAVPVMMFVGGFNAEYTIQTLDGMAMGVR